MRAVVAAHDDLAAYANVLSADFVAATPPPGQRRKDISEDTP
ncbi:hypothetical protein ACK8N7_37795 (plasmid) [Streptomyces griseobrunneus]